MSGAVWNWVCAVVVSQESAVCGRVAVSGKWLNLHCLFWRSCLGFSDGHAARGMLWLFWRVELSEKWYGINELQRGA